MEICLPKMATRPASASGFSIETNRCRPALPRWSSRLCGPVARNGKSAFVADKGCAQSLVPVEEPHVFEAAVAARTANAAYRFTLAQEEGKVKLSDAQIQAAAIAIDKAAPARIRTIVQLPGEIHSMRDRTAHVVPRLAGVVKKRSANLGQAVKKGQVLGRHRQHGLVRTAQRAALGPKSATPWRSRPTSGRRSSGRTRFPPNRTTSRRSSSHERSRNRGRQRPAEADRPQRQQRSDGALNRATVRAPFDGMVVEKHIALGRAVRRTPAFHRLDCPRSGPRSSCPPAISNTVRIGEPAIVKATAFDSKRRQSLPWGAYPARRPVPPGHGDAAQSADGLAPRTLRQCRGEGGGRSRSPGCRRGRSRPDGQ